MVTVALFSWHPELGGHRLWLLMVVLWESTAFSDLRVVGDYNAMTTWSTANWDVTPGTGTLTVVGLAVAAVTALAPRCLRTLPPVAQAETVPLSAAIH